MKKYFLNRRQWGVELEKKLSKLSDSLEKHWSEICEERIEAEKSTIRNEKDLEITILKKDLSKLKDENKYLKNSDLKVEKLKNELIAKIKRIDYQTRLLEEVQSRISVQLGMNDSIMRSSEKLLNKEE